MDKETSLGKKIVLEFLDFLRFKVENDKLTMEETESIAKVIENNMTLTGTADDFSKFYGQSKENVRVVINRKVLDKPKRCVTYHFNAFRKAVPKSWTDKKKSNGGG